MSFLSSVFSGASNNFSPGGGNAQQGRQIQAANENYSNAQGGLNSLAEMLQQQAQGKGPNLANAQLQQATGQNVANQAALMAGQRGASANPALIARQAAMQGAGIQQQAAGQASQNVLAQQLAAQGQLGGVYGTEGGLANQNYGITQGAVTGANQQGLEASGQNAKMNQGLMGGIGNAVGSITGLFAEGGDVQPMQAMPMQQVQPSFLQNFLGMGKPQMNQESQAFNQAVINDGRETALGLSHPGQMNPQAAQSAQESMRRAFHFAQGGMALPFAPMDLKQGGEVAARAPEEQANVPGNSLKNDKIPAMVSEGEIVIPRDVAMSANAPTLAAQFVAAVKSGKHRK